MRTAPVAIVILAALAIAPLAHAADQRYASPNGNGENCTSSAPCSLEQAVTKAEINDEVIVRAGEYPLAGPVETPPNSKNVFVHGAFGGAMPRISAKTSAAPIGFEDIGGRISYLDIANEKNSANGATCYGPGSSIERVHIHVIGQDAVAAGQYPGCVVRDSVFLAEGQDSRGLSATSTAGKFLVVARNVTALASGPGSVGIFSFFLPIGFGGTFTLDLKNSIASGEASDLQAAGNFSTIVVSHSNFGSTDADGDNGITDAGSNQSAAPKFVDAAGGDYREAVGSPTIDAGVADQIGSTDLDGNPRNLGGAPDIGAFEASPSLSPAPSAAGLLQALALTPRRFRAAGAGDAAASAQRRRKPPLGSTIEYRLSAPGVVAFKVERATRGRRVGGKCRKATRQNAGNRRCTIWKAKRGSFADDGGAGANKLKFTGRLNGRALGVGRYRLVGEAGGALKRVSFRIVR